MEEQVVILYCAKHGYLDDVPFYDVARFNAGLIAFIKENEPAVLGDISDQSDLTASNEDKLKDVANRYREHFKPSQT